MKLLIFVATIALTSATSVDNKHYSQHQSSVDSARSTMNERLSKLESQQRQYSSGGRENYVAGCSSCVGGGTGSTYNSRSSSSSSSSLHNSRSSSGGVGSDYVGVGIVGHSADGQLSSRFSSAYEQDDLQQRVVPGDLNGVQASAYRASETEHDEDDVQRTVGVGYRDAAVNSDRYSYSQRRQQQQQREESDSSSRIISGRPLPVYYVPAGGSISSSQRHLSGSESERHEVRGGQAVPIDNYIRMTVRPGTATVLQVPVRVNYVPGSSDHSATSSRSEYASGSESSNTRVQPGYRVSYYPSNVYSSSSTADRSRSESESRRVSGSQQAEKLTSQDLTNYNSYSRDNSRYNNDYEDNQVQERVSPTISGSSSSQHGSSSSGSTSSSVRGGYAGVRVPAFPVHTVESTSSQRTAEEREQRRYTPARPTYVTSSRVSESDDSRSHYGSRTSQTSVGEGSSSYGSSGTSYYTAPTSQNQYQSQSQYQSTAGSQSQHQASGSGYLRTGYGGYPRPGQLSSSNLGSASSLSNSHLSSRFGSGVMSAGSDDLNQYMSESERLARVQQQQIAGSSRTATGVSSVDEANRRTVNTAQHLDAAAASFVSGTNQAHINNAMDTIETLPGSGNGFQRVKSWSKQSKWASGSEYDNDGKIKSHSMLSTAESEKHNVNGEETGYKAATTTLENDGKVSTYSIHTP